MRVMHIIDSLAVGGAERMLVSLANRSLADGLEVSVCATRAGGPLAGELDARIPLRILPRRRRIDPWSFAALERFAAERRTELFHAHGRSSFTFLAAAATIGSATAPIVLHDHNGAPFGRREKHPIRAETKQSRDREGAASSLAPQLTNDRHFLAKLLAPPTWLPTQAGHPRPQIPIWMRFWGAALVNQYVGATEGVVTWAERARVPRGRIRVIENAIETRRYGMRIPLPPLDARGMPRPLTGVVIANLRPEKGIEVLLRALARVAPHRQPLIWICGDVRDADYAQQCRELARTLGLRGSVRFLGPRDDIPQLLANADFGAIPSISESGPLVLAEILAAGLPVVATAAGSLAQRARDLGARDFVPAGDEAAMAEALERLISLSPAERAARGAQGRAIAQRHFDIAAAMPRWYNVYEDALRNRRL